MKHPAQRIYSNSSHHGVLLRESLSSDRQHRYRWFTEWSGNKIGRITPSGVITEFTIPTPSSNPGGIAAGPDGNIWFIEQNGNKIGQLIQTH